MAHKPLVRSCRGICTARTGDSPARQGFPLVTGDCACKTLGSGKGEAYLVLYPVVCWPREVAGTVLVALHILCSHHTLRNRPAMPGMKFRNHSCTDRDTAKYPNR